MRLNQTLLGQTFLVGILLWALHCIVRVQGLQDHLFPQSHHHCHRQRKNIVNKLRHHHHDDDRSEDSPPASLLSRRQTLATIAAATTTTTTAIVTAKSDDVGWAAPPIAVIAEELGYFPVQNKKGEVVYIPKRIQRSSTPQAVELAKFIRENYGGLTMYGAYWCPHCSRQKELFGSEAFAVAVRYVECSPKGYGYQGPNLCQTVDGFPTFRDSKSRGQRLSVSGERSLEFFAQQVGFTDFDPSLEGDVPMVGTTCKLR